MLCYIVLDIILYFILYCILLLLYYILLYYKMFVLYLCYILYRKVLHYIVLYILCSLFSCVAPCIIGFLVLFVTFYDLCCNAKLTHFL